MNPQELAAQFSKEFGELVNRALSQGVSPMHVSATIDQGGFEFKMGLLQMKMQAQAEAATKAIIPANGNFKLPPRG